MRWKVKGGDASPSDMFVYALTSDQSGRMYKNLQPVVDYLKRNPALRSNGFEVSLSGDGKFINREKS
jgi:hypothetical protein